MHINKKRILIRKQTEHILRNAAEDSPIYYLCKKQHKENQGLLVENQQLREENTALKAANETDPLTGLLNPIEFQNRVVKFFVKAHEPDEFVAIFSMDMDGFKTVNDTLGHIFGDIVLQVFCSALQRVFRHDDVVGRMGGDEFAVGIHIKRNAVRTIATPPEPSSIQEDYSAYLEQAYDLCEERMRYIQNDLMGEVIKNLNQRPIFLKSPVGKNLSVSCAYCISNNAMHSLRTPQMMAFKDPLELIIATEPRKADETILAYGKKCYDTAYTKTDLLMLEAKEERHLKSNTSRRRN